MPVDGAVPAPTKRVITENRSRAPANLCQQTLLVPAVLIYSVT
jgi:hypothetical protein